MEQEEVAWTVDATRHTLGARQPVCLDQSYTPVAGQYATGEKPEVTADQTSSAGQLPTRRGLWHLRQVYQRFFNAWSQWLPPFSDRSRSHGLLSRACWRPGSVRLIGNGQGYPAHHTAVTQLASLSASGFLCPLHPRRSPTRLKRILPAMHASGTRGGLSSRIGLLIGNVVE